MPPAEQSKEDAKHMGLWTRAANNLDPRDREKLDNLIRSKVECLNGHGPDSLADEVNSTLSRAEKLKEESKEVTWRPVVDKIIKGALTFKSLGDAAVAFDKSGYAALGWSVVSFGLQLAANAEDTREFVLSSSEVITRFMAKYTEYERIFRGPESGEQFDRLLTNVYKALLLYVIALDKYLRQSGPGLLEDQSISSSKKAVDTADAEVRDWNEDLPVGGEAPGVQAEPNVVILSFFFHDRGTDLQRTPLGLFRSLLHQLLRQVPGAIPATLLTTFQDRETRMGEVGEKWDWKWREVRHFFEISLRKVLESRQVCLFIDALDEYGEDDANELIKSFNSWIQTSPPQAQFHICYTCRHYPPLSLPGGMVEIRLEEENKDDISTYVQTQLSAWSNNETLATIWMDITDRSSGVFIWARLIVPRVLRLERRGENWKKIKREIENTPQALDDLYRGLARKVAAEPGTLKLIEWICFAMEPLTLNELRWAMIVDPHYSDEPVSLQHYEDTEDFATSCDMMEKRLKALSCGLAEAVPSSHVVQFIHQSVKDFFMKEGLVILHRSQSPAGSEANEADLKCTAHNQLSKTCIRYFSAEEIIQSRLHPESPTWEDDFPLLRYAVIHWTAHVQQSEEKGPQTDLLRYFGWPSEQVVQRWSKFHWSMAEDWDWQNGTTLLHVASRYQLMGPLLGILQSKELLENKIDASDDENRTPLWWAAYEGHEAVVRLLLDNGANINAVCGEYGHALRVASLEANEQVIRVLLDYGADINVQCGGLGNALQVASCNRSEQVVRLLLECGADVNARCGYYGNALQAASYAGNEQIVRLLLENGADINADGGRYGTALNAASFRGHGKVSQMLLEKGADVNAGEHDKALVLASFKGHEQIVRMLLENGADVDARSQNFSNSNALDRASLRGHEEIVQILLEYGAGRERSAP
ncbi:hypothetical protein INS49_003382 [Diaporthe citri]|uniref:uncharacterized protein n=1 Tax=Diaporthe citri TaxID=83186 RepID=UPI001C806636|nr:uncharacterized protein INS49_003382 [Diaporthe citri]KAG6355420.1 hypothetical protein INS49_003382 [Diaporthe citri]